ncbi:MAG: ABC transporter ATP-binding protein [Eubacteriales bacterium]
MKFNNLNITLGGVAIIDSFTAEIPNGGITALTGASGSGKTTLLRAVCGLCPFTGEIIYPGGKKQSRRPLVACAFQEPRLLPWYTVRKNLSLVNAAEKDIGDLLSRLGLYDDADKLPEELSGGMRTRVSLARALLYAAGNTDALVILDEPTTGLDASAAEKACVLIRELCGGHTVITATHSERDISILGAGRIEIKPCVKP